MSLLEVDARRRFAEASIDVTFTAEGGVTALFGASGAGKTTVINMLAGLERPDSGRIAVAGRVLFDAVARIDVAPEARRLGYVFQEDRLFPHFSVERNLTYGMNRLANSERRVEFGPVVEMLGIGHLLRRRPHTLSGGEKQRGAIGRALLASPRLLLMDEPLANLDEPRRNEILPFLERLREELAIPIVYVSHNVEEVLRLADTMVVMAGGRTVAVGPVEDVLSRVEFRPWTGVQDAGAVFTATIEARDEYGLTGLAFPGGVIRAAGLDLREGTRVRLRVHARDVSVALEKPLNISILNVFPGTVIEVDAKGGAHVDVLVDVGVPLWARITRRSAHDLGIAPRRKVFALIKALAIDRGSIGHRDPATAS